MKYLQKLGGFSAFYLAMSYVFGFAIFIIVLDYPSITNPSQKMELIVNQKDIIFTTNILMYVLFGFFLIFLNLALYEKLKDKTPILIKIATSVGIVWAALLIGSGMVSNAGLIPAITLYQADPVQGTTYWYAIETIANGLGGQNGEILGGVMTLLISVAGLRGGLLPKNLNFLGIIVGVVGIITILPGFVSFVSIFAMSQIIWFIWLGIILVKTTRD